MPRFSIRFLFCLTSAAAVVSLTAVRSHWAAAVGVAGATSLAWLAFAFCKTPASRWWRCALLLAAAGIGWMAAIDRSTWVDYCQDCSDHRFITEYRLCGVPIHSSKHPTHRSIGSLFCEDLGHHCEHDFERTHLTRRWGLTRYCSPHIGITCCLGLPESYTDEVRDAVREYAKQEPSKATALVEEIAVRDNFEAMWEFLKRFEPQQDATDEQPPP